MALHGDFRAVSVAAPPVSDELLGVCKCCAKRLLSVFAPPVKPKPGFVISTPLGSDSVSYSEPHPVPTSSLGFLGACSKLLGKINSTPNPFYSVFSVEAQSWVKCISILLVSDSGSSRSEVKGQSVTAPAVTWLRQALIKSQLQYWHITKTTLHPDGSHWLLLFCNSCPFVNCFYCLYILFRLPFFL